MVSPAHAIGERVLQRCPRKGGDDEDAPAQARLLFEWMRLHSVLHEGKDPAPKTLPDHKLSLHYVSVCRRAGECICKPRMEHRLKFLTVLSSD